MLDCQLSARMNSRFITTYRS